MTHDESLILLATGISNLIKKLETLERCIDKLSNCVNDLTVCIEAAPLLDAEEVAEAEAEYLDSQTFDPAKTH